MFFNSWCQEAVPEGFTCSVRVGYIVQGLKVLLRRMPLVPRIFVLASHGFFTCVSSSPKHYLVLYSVTARCKINTHKCYLMGFRFCCVVTWMNFSFIANIMNIYNMISCGLLHRKLLLLAWEENTLKNTYRLVAW